MISSEGKVHFFILGADPPPFWIFFSLFVTFLVWDPSLTTFIAVVVGGWGGMQSNISVKHDKRILFCRVEVGLGFDNQTLFLLFSRHFII